jgi:alkanesulfonate monooxygenase SsuD/methylene tetrahydromethanopterin reductase-like flavin-dependent oxidoreductase (luciferase family)
MLAAAKAPCADRPFDLSVWTDMRPDPSQPDFPRRYAEALDEARAADEAGFRSFWTTEVHAVDDGYLGAQFPVLAGVATVTSRLRLLTSALLLPFYNLRQVLEATVAVDLLSGGRMELGVAAGAYDREFDLFGVDRRRRGRMMEDGLRFLRAGLTEGELPDGPGGTSLPFTPPPAQARLPLLVGGMAPPAVDRAARLADGLIAYDYEDPERNFPRHWADCVAPALAERGRTREDFRYLVGTSLWVSDDPERAWAEVYGPALRYQQRRYAEWYGARGPDPGVPAEADAAASAFVGTPEEVARRLVRTWRDAPWHELGFFYRLPGITHTQALEHLDLIRTRLMPALQRELDVVG